MLGDGALYEQWRAELRTMARRVQRMRQMLADELRAVGAPAPDGGDWSHVTAQIGMFAYTGMTPEMCDQLTADYNIFLTRDGRISVAGVNSGNVDYIAAAVHDVTKGKSIGA